MLSFHALSNNDVASPLVIVFYFYGFSVLEFRFWSSPIYTCTALGGRTDTATGGGAGYQANYNFTHILPVVSPIWSLPHKIRQIYPPMSKISDQTINAREVGLVTRTVLHIHRSTGQSLHGPNYWGFYIIFDPVNH